MDLFKDMIISFTDRLTKLAKSRTIIGQPVGDEHSVAIPLCELSLGFGAGKAGISDADLQTKKANGAGNGQIGGMGGGFKMRPVAVLIVDKHGARIEPGSAD